LPPETETVVVGDAALWTETTGDGDTVVVLCHGGPGLSDNLGGLASLIDDRASVRRYDQRASGRSTGGPPFTVERFVDDLEALRRHWDHPTWIVGGHSWGGWLALRYALRFPSHVRGLIAVGTPPPPSDGWRPAYLAARAERMSREERAFFEDVRSRRRVGGLITPDEERRWAHLSWRTDFADPAAMPSEPLFPFPPNYAVNRALNDEMDRWDATGRIHTELAAIQAPTLFVHGTGDPRAPASSLASDLPHARLVTIEGAGHLPWIERPDDVAAAIRRFLADVS
jgi:proline iminopeptidase